jgi:hypothetical protein
LSNKTISDESKNKDMTQEKLNKLALFMKKHDIDVNQKSISIPEMNVECIIQAYEGNDLPLLLNLEKHTNFSETFKMGLEYYFFLSKKFLNQSYELAQFTVKHIKQLDYPIYNNDINSLILENDDKRVQCFIFESFFLNKPTWLKQEFKDTFQLIMNHNDWKFKIELFSLNDEFNNIIKNTSPNILHTLLMLSNKKNLPEQVRYLIDEKNVNWSNDINNVVPSINYVFRNSQGMVETLKLITSLPNILLVPNIMHTFQEIVNGFSIKESSKKEAQNYLIQVEQQLLSEKIKAPKKGKKLKI